MSLNEKTAAGSALLITTIMVQSYNAYPTPDLPLPLLVLCFILWVVVVVDDDVLLLLLFCCCFCFSRDFSLTTHLLLVRMRQTLNGQIRLPEVDGKRCTHDKTSQKTELLREKRNSRPDCLLACVCISSLCGGIPRTQKARSPPLRIRLCQTERFLCFYAVVSQCWLSSPSVSVCVCGGGGGVTVCACVYTCVHVCVTLSACVRVGVTVCVRAACMRLNCVCV